MRHYTSWDVSAIPEFVGSEISTEEADTALPPDSNCTKPARTTVLLDPDTMEQYWQRITSVMEKSRPYLVHGFSVAQLAELTQIKRNQLSFTINLKSGLVFQEFVNDYRVRYAVTLLEDVANSSSPIKAIMLDSGFRSSSAFHANFRRVTGVSPMKFRAGAIKQ